MMSEGEYDRYRDISPQALPNAPIYPEDIDWIALDQSLAVEVFGFQNGSSAAQSQAEYARLWENNPFEFRVAAKNRGLQALTLADRLRRSNQLGKTSKDLDRLWRDFKG